MSGRRSSYFSITAILIILVISGCVSEPAQEGTPTPVATTPGTNVEVLNAPGSVEAGQSFEISWRVNSPEEKNIPHTAVHYGPESKSEPLTVQSYQDLTTPQTGLIPAEFKANLVINRTGIIYFRAHAIVDSENYWSDEMTVTVSAPVTENVSATAPTIRVTSIPSSVDGETNFTIQWEVAGGTPGDIGHTAIHWGFNSGGADIKDYPRLTTVQTGKTPQVFSTEIKAPSGGTGYFRAHAIVDGKHVYSQEYRITFVTVTRGGGY